jgi:hypothetical protein
MHRTADLLLYRFQQTRGALVRARKYRRCLPRSLDHELICAGNGCVQYAGVSGAAQPEGVHRGSGRAVYDLLGRVGNSSVRALLFWILCVADAERRRLVQHEAARGDLVCDCGYGGVWHEQYRADLRTFYGKSKFA